MHTNLRKVDHPYRRYENMKEKPNLKWEASEKYRNYEGNIEVNGYDFQRSGKKCRKHE